MKVPSLDLSWPGFLGLVLLAVGVWLEAVFAALFIPEMLGYPDYQSGPAPAVEDSAILVFLVLGLVMIALSWPVARRKNWARLTIIGGLLAACLVMLVLLGVRLFAWHFRTPDDVGAFVLGVGGLIIPLAMLGFLLNRQVAEAFVPGATAAGVECREQPAGGFVPEQPPVKTDERFTRLD
jgi:hypothetical protein